MLFLVYFMEEHVLVNSALLEDVHTFKLWDLKFDGIFFGGVDGLVGLVDDSERALINEFADLVFVVFSDKGEWRLTFFRFICFFHGCLSLMSILFILV